LETPGKLRTLSGDTIGSIEEETGGQGGGGEKKNSYAFQIHDWVESILEKLAPSLLLLTDAELGPAYHSVDPYIHQHGWGGN
jgi:hypothetical protein